MTNTEREALIKQKLQTGEWKIKTKKTGFEILNKGGTVIAKAPTRHAAERLAVVHTQGE